MALCYYHPLCEEHDPGPNHSENARRLMAIHQLLQSKSLPSLKLIEMPVGKREIIELVHTKDYVDFVFNSVPVTGYKEIEINEVISEHDDGEVTVLSPRSGDALIPTAL